jgi:hypothetical protein
MVWIKWLSSRRNEIDIREKLPIKIILFAYSDSSRKGFAYIWEPLH